jgi:hypothetical protein
MPEGKASDGEAEGTAGTTAAEGSTEGATGTEGATDGAAAIGATVTTTAGVFSQPPEMISKTIERERNDFMRTPR